MSGNFTSRFVPAIAFALTFAVFGSSLIFAQQVDIGAQAAAIKAIGPKGKGHKEAIAAVEQLRNVPKKQLPEMLRTMDDMQLLASNWMRPAIETVADKSGDLPVDQLLAFLKEEGHSQQARRIAYELIVDHDAAMATQLLPNMLEDTSLENRRDAVAHALKLANKIDKEANKDEAIAAYQKALDSARSIKQVESIIKTLKKLDVEVSITKRLGFITDWRVIAPFDNTDQSGFDVAYPPESAVNLDESLPGKTEKVSWVKVDTDDRMGNVDLADKLGEFKGAIAYAHRDFISSDDLFAEIRIGTPNAVKIWLNGELVLSNEIYHAGTSVDQYKAPLKLKKGKNTILMKVCQNEQEQQWAQDWKFQVRICDSTGKAIYSQERNDENI